MRRFSIPVAMSILLAACGGGGGGGGGLNVPTGAEVPLAAANYDPVGRAAAASIADAASSGATTQVLAQAGSGPAALPASMLALSRYALGVGVNAMRPADAPAQTTGGNYACAGGGTMYVSATDANNNNVFDAGDSMGASLSNCAVEVGGPVANGAFSLSINSITYNGLNQVTAGSLSMSFTNFTTQGSSLSGNVSVSMNMTTGLTTMQYQQMVSTRAGKTNVYNYTVTVNSSSGTDQVTMAGTFIVGANNGRYTLSTPVTLVAGVTHPVSGTLRVTDSAGGHIDLIAGADSFDIDLYLPGDAVRDGHVTYTWAQLLSGAI